MPPNPFASHAEHLIEQYPRDADVERIVRRGDARLRLQELTAAETSFAEQERNISAIADPLQRRQAGHQLNMDCLVRFGCRADEREIYRDVLAGVARQGDLTLFQAATMTSMIFRQRNQMRERLDQRSGQSGTITLPTGSAEAATGIN